MKERKKNHRKLPLIFFLNGDLWLKRYTTPGLFSRRIKF